MNVLKACKSISDSDFEERFSTLRDWYCPSIANKLVMIGLEMWARSSLTRSGTLNIDKQQKLSKCRAAVCRNLANVGQQMANLKASQKSGKVPGGHTFHGYDAKLKTNEECCNPGFIDFASPLLDSRNVESMFTKDDAFKKSETIQYMKKVSEVISTFEEGKLSFEKYVLALRDTVGIQLLVKAIAIGKEKWDLTAKDKKCCYKIYKDYCCDGMNHKAVEIHGVADSPDCESSDGNNGQPARNQKLVLKQKQKRHDDSKTSNEKASGEDKAMEDARPKKKCCVLLIDLNILIMEFSSIKALEALAYGLLEPEKKRKGSEDTMRRSVRAKTALVSSNSDNNNAMINTLAGHTSAIKAMPLEVLANAYQMSPQQAWSLKNNRQETVMFSPSTRSSGRPITTIEFRGQQTQFWHTGRIPVISALSWAEIQGNPTGSEAYKRRITFIDSGFSINSLGARRRFKKGMNVVEKKGPSQQEAEKEKVESGLESGSASVLTMVELDRRKAEEDERLRRELNLAAKKLQIIS
ncbi:homeodomain-like protein [Tanacetum coccineum]